MGLFTLLHNTFKLLPIDGHTVNRRGAEIDYYLI
jgi:hypothetical protein